MGKDFKSLNSGASAGGAPKRDFGGASRGGAGGRGGFSRGGGRGGFGGGGFQQGPPERVEAVCEFSHTCGAQIIVKATNLSKVPKFNRGIYLENKTKVGTIDEIFGPISGYYFSANLVDGVIADSYKAGDKFYMGWEDTLPIDRFLPRAKGAAGPARRGPGGAGGAFRGGFSRGGARGGSDRGGRGGFSRGGARGGGDRGRGGFSRGGDRGGKRF